MKESNYYVRVLRCGIHAGKNDDGERREWLKNNAVDDCFTPLGDKILIAHVAYGDTQICNLSVDIDSYDPINSSHKVYGFSFKLSSNTETKQWLPA